MTVIALHATPEEVYHVEILKAFYMRKTNSDLLRFLINEQAKKILPQNVSIDTQDIASSPNTRNSHAD